MNVEFNHKKNILQIFIGILLAVSLCSGCNTKDEIMPENETIQTYANESTEINIAIKSESDVLINESTLGASEAQTNETEQYEEKEPKLGWKKCATYDMGYLFKNGVPEPENDFYLLEESDERYITQEELKDFNSDKLEMAMNEIYARKGYISKEAYVQAYFNCQKWYKPITGNPSKLKLNEYEIENIRLLEEQKKTEQEIDDSMEETDKKTVCAFDDLVCRMWFKNSDYITGSWTGIIYYDWYRISGEEEKSFGDTFVSEVSILKEGHRCSRTIPVYKEENGIFVKSEIGKEDRFWIISKDKRGLQINAEGTMLIKVVLNTGEYRYIPVYRNETTSMEFYCEDGICLYDHLNEEEFSMPGWYYARFSFTVAWGEDGRSTYDSKTGELVKNIYAENKELYTTKYMLYREEMEDINNCLCKSIYEYSLVKIIEIPPSYVEDQAESFCFGFYDRFGTSVQISCSNLGSEYRSETQKQIIELRDVIVGILTSTDEWNRLPD